MLGAILIGFAISYLAVSSAFVILAISEAHNVSFTKWDWIAYDVETCKGYFANLSLFGFVLWFILLLPAYIIVLPFYYIFLLTKRRKWNEKIISSSTFVC